METELTFMLLLLFSRSIPIQQQPLQVHSFETVFGGSLAGAGVHVAGALLDVLW